MGCTTSRPCSVPNKYQTQVDDFTGTSAATAWESPHRPKQTKISNSHAIQTEPRATNEPTITSTEQDLPESRNPLSISAEVHRSVLWQPDAAQAEPLETSYGSLEISSAPRRSRRRQSHSTTRRRKSPMSSSSREHSHNRHTEAESLSPSSKEKQSVAESLLSTPSAPSPPTSRPDRRPHLDVSSSDHELGNSSKSLHSQKSNRSSDRKRRSSQKKTNLDTNLSPKNDPSLPRQPSDRSCASKRSTVSSSQIHHPVASKKRDHSSKGKSTRGKRLPENELRFKPPVKDSSTVESTPPSSTPNTPLRQSQGELLEANSTTTNQPAEEPSSLHALGIHRSSQPSTSLNGPSQHSSSIGGPSLHSNNSLNNYLPQHMKSHKNSPKRMAPTVDDSISLPSLVSFSSVDPDNTNHTRIPEGLEVQQAAFNPSVRPSLRDLVQKLTPSSRHLEFEALESLSSGEADQGDKKHYHHHQIIDLSQPEEGAPTNSEKEGDANNLQSEDGSEQSMEMQTLESDDKSDDIHVFKYDSSDPSVKQFHLLESKPATPRSTNSMTEVDRVHVRRAVRGTRSSKRASNNRQDHLHSSLSQIDALEAAEVNMIGERPSRGRKSHKAKEETSSPRRRHTIEQGHNKKTLPSNRTRRPARNSTGDVDGLLPSPPKQHRSSPRQKRRTTPILTGDLDATDIAK